MARRDDEATLRLAREVVDDALASPVLDTSHGDVRFHVGLQMSPGATALTINEPAKRPLRDLLVVLRKLDMPTHDAELGRVYAALDRVEVKPEWQQGLAAARHAFEHINDVEMFRVQVEDEPPPEELEKVGKEPTWITPRTAFGLWLDGEIVHDDLTKLRRWEGMDAFRQGLVRKMAHEYMFELLQQAEFLARLLPTVITDSTG